MITPKQILGESYKETMEDIKRENDQLRAFNQFTIDVLNEIHKRIPLSEETDDMLSKLNSELRFFKYERAMAEKLDKHLTARLRREEHGVSKWEVLFEKASNIPIEGIVRSFNRTGNLRYNINCPLHKDKSPSFSCSTKKNVWHCFSCGEGGKPIQLIMKMYNMSFKEAVYFINENFHD